MTHTPGPWKVDEMPRSIIEATEKQREIVSKWCDEHGVKISGVSYRESRKLREELVRHFANVIAERSAYGEPKKRPEKARRP